MAHSVLQMVTADESEKSGLNGFFASIKRIWNTIWNGLVDFFTGRTCRNKCSSFFDITCHIQYICVSWILLFGLLLAIFPTVIVLLWLLHQKGFFDPLYDWWDDRSGGGQKNKTHLKYGKGVKRSHTRNLLEDYGTHHNGRNQPFHMQKKRRSSSHPQHALQRHDHLALASDHHHRKNGSSHLHAHKERHKHKNSKGYPRVHKLNQESRDGHFSREIGAVRDPHKMAKKHEENRAGLKHSRQQLKDVW